MSCEVVSECDLLEMVMAESWSCNALFWVSSSSIRDSRAAFKVCVSLDDVSCFRSDEHSISTAVLSCRSRFKVSVATCNFVSRVVARES